MAVTSVAKPGFVSKVFFDIRTPEKSIFSIIPGKLGIVEEKGKEQRKDRGCVSPVLTDKVSVFSLFCQDLAGLCMAALPGAGLDLVFFHAVTQGVAGHAKPAG